MSEGKLSISCLGFAPMEKGTLKGFMVIKIDELSFVIHEVAVHATGNSRWVQLPSRPWIRDSKLVLNADGKPQYSPLIEITSKPVRDAFSQRAVAALLVKFPNALHANVA